MNPQERAIREACRVLEKGGTILYPTDSTYGFACSIDSIKAIEAIRKIKNVPDAHKFTLVMGSFSEIAQFAKVSNWAFRIVKRALPGPFTFVLNAMPEVPKKILPKRKTVGVRIPDHPVCAALLEEFGRPLISTTAQWPGEDPISDPADHKNRLQKSVDLVLDAGFVPLSSTTVVDLTDDEVEVIREGDGDVSLLG